MRPAEQLRADKGVFSKVVLGFRNFGYDYVGMFEDDSAETCTTSVDGGPSGGFRVRRPGSENPTGILGIFLFLVVGTVVQNPRRGCRRVPKFCMATWRT